VNFILLIKNLDNFLLEIMYDYVSNTTSAVTIE